MQQRRRPFRRMYCPATAAWSSWATSCAWRRNAPPSRCSGTMAARGVSCRVGIQPLHHEPFFRRTMGELHLPVTEQAARDTMFLPIYPGLTEPQQAQVVAALKDTLARGA